MASAGLTRRALALGAATALAACGSRQTAAPAEPDFARQVAALPPIPPGQSRVVVMRDDYVKGGYGEARVNIGGQPVGGLRDGAVLARDVAPGRYLMGIDHGQIDYVEFNDFAVDARPGAAVYVRLVYYVTAGKEQPFTQQTMGHGGRGSNLPGTPTKIGNFRFSELPGPPR